MAVTLDSGMVRVLMQAKSLSALDLSTPEDNLRVTFQTDFTNGTGANQANRAWHDTRTLTTGANEDLDFAGGVTDAFGNAVTFAAIKAIYVFAKTANTTNLTISRPANGLVLFAASGDALAVLKPGGMFLYTDPSAAGLTVTASTGDLLNIANSAGASASYDIVVIGEV